MKRLVCSSIIVSTLWACATDAPPVPLPAALVVAPESMSLLSGDTVRLSAKLIDSHGDSVATPSVVWQSLDTMVAQVDAAGTAWARALGQTTVSVAVDTFTTVVTVRTIGSIDFMSGNCGVISGGAAYCWSPFDHTAPPTAVPGGVSFAALSTGQTIHCGLTAAGAARCWGQSTPLGDGTTLTSTTPVPVAGGLTFLSVVANATSVCGLTTSRAPYCWGTSARGMTPAFQQAVPGQVAGSPVLASLRGGQGHHVCGLTAAGAAYCWGDNIYGELGATGASSCTPGHNCSYTPLAVAGAHQFSALAIGYWHSCGIDTAGDTWCWGDNTGGALGTDSVMTSCQGGAVPNHYCSMTPVRLASPLRFTSLALGTYNSCGLVASGQAYCWGANFYRELGPAGSPAASATPVAVAGSLRFSRITAGDTGYCGKSLGGAVYCWGLGWDDVPVALSFQS